MHWPKSRRRARPRQARRWVACGLTALWVLMLLGPLGLGGLHAHQHETGQSDHSCLVCLLLQSAVARPDDASPLAAPAAGHSGGAQTPVSVCVSPVYSPAAPRAPPPVISV
ncbi:MAG: hypothetical protein FJX74_02880 [Armatimonadetes bacterium]|nr:hypothetical protein [Armatimonadota bacterium]